MFNKNYEIYMSVGSSNLYDILSAMILNQRLLKEKIYSSEKEIFYISSFLNYSPSTSGLYIDYTGQMRFWSGSEWEYSSNDIANNISELSTSGTIPTSKAVYDFFQSEVSGIVSEPEVFYISSFLNYVPSTSGLFINQEGETRFWTGSEWEYTSNEIVDNIDPNTLSITKNYIPTVSAVYDFVQYSLLNYTPSQISGPDSYIPVQTLGGTTINPDHLAIYNYTLSGNEIFNFIEPQTNSVVNFRLYLSMPSSLVSFQLPNNIIWDTEPDFQTAEALYMLVFEWNPIVNKWLGNQIWEPISLI